MPSRRGSLEGFPGTEFCHPVPFHLQEWCVGLGYPRGRFSVSEHAAAHALVLPVYPELAREMRGWVVSSLLGFIA